MSAPVKIRGIVVRTTKYSESSVICAVYTDLYGMQSFIINGIRSKKTSPGKASMVQVMSMLDMVVFYRENKGLHRVKELQPAYVYHRLPFEILRSSIGMFMTEIVLKTVKEEEENPDLFDFITGSFLALDQMQEGIPNLHLWFMVHLAGHLGFMPSGAFKPFSKWFDMREGQFVAEEPVTLYGMDEADSELLDKLMRISSDELQTIEINGVQRRRFIDKMIQFFRIHLDYVGEIHSHQVLREVL